MAWRGMAWHGVAWLAGRLRRPCTAPGGSHRPCSCVLPRGSLTPAANLLLPTRWGAGASRRPPAWPGPLAVHWRAVGTEPDHRSQINGHAAFTPSSDATHVQRRVGAWASWSHLCGQPCRSTCAACPLPSGAHSCRSLVEILCRGMRCSQEEAASIAADAAAHPAGPCMPGYCCPALHSWPGGGHAIAALPWAARPPAVLPHLDGRRRCRVLQVMPQNSGCMWSSSKLTGVRDD